MDQVLVQVDKIIEKLGLSGCDNIEPLKPLCQKLKISRPSYLVFGVLAVSIGMIVLGLASGLITNILGFLYPAYKSIQAMNTEGQADDKQWLTYWIVFSLTSVIDENFEFILEFIPFFHLLKLVFLFYLFHPDYQGAEKVYNLAIKPLYAKYHQDIDAKINEYTNKGKKFLEEKGKKLMEEGKKSM